MNRLARLSMLTVPGICFIALTHLVPSMRPFVEAAADPQAIQLDPARAILMKAHYREAITVHDAVIRGDLPAIGPAAAALASAQIPGGAPAAATAPMNAMKAAAARAAAATTLATASREAATMLASCGECHTAAGTRPALPIAPPSDVGGVVGHMLEHQRAVDQMLQGLVVPSATLWRQGAEGLKTAPLHRSDLPRDAALTRDVTAAEKRVHQMAGAAATMDTPAARAGQYARILTTCAECHSAHRKIWGPSRR
jgi:cytochrome c553